MNVLGAGKWRFSHRRHLCKSMKQLLLLSLQSVGAGRQAQNGAPSSQTGREGVANRIDGKYS